MQNIKRICIFLFAILMIANTVSGYTYYEPLSMSNITNSAGTPLSEGNITILLYSTATDTTPIYNNTFEDSISNGKFDELINSSLFTVDVYYGSVYEMDILINEENATFGTTGTDRTDLTFSNGIVNATHIPTATPSDGDTTHLSTADHIRDYVIGLGYSTTTGTVTSIATTAPISGGTITSTGTISLATATPSDGDTTHASTADQIYDWVISLNYKTLSEIATDLGNWSLDKGSYWNESSDLSDDEIAEAKISFSTACGAGNHYYLNGNDLACEADDDTTYTEDSPYLGLTGTTFNFIDSYLNNTIDDRDTDTDTNAKTLCGDNNVLLGQDATTCINLNNTIDDRDSDTQLTEEQVEDYVGGMLGGTETLITVTYQDATNDIDFVVNNDLHGYNWANVVDADITDTLTCSNLVSGSAVVDISTESNLAVGTGITLTDDTLTVVGGTAITADAGGVSVTGDSIGNTQLEHNTGQHLTASSTPAFEGMNASYNNITQVECIIFSNGADWCSG